MWQTLEFSYLFTSTESRSLPLLPAPHPAPIPVPWNLLEASSIWIARVKGRWRKAWPKRWKVKQHWDKFRPPFSLQCLRMVHVFLLSGKPSRKKAWACVVLGKGTVHPHRNQKVSSSPASARAERLPASPRPFRVPSAKIPASTRHPELAPGKEHVAENVTGHEKLGCLREPWWELQRKGSSMCLVLLLLTDIQTTPNATRSWAITVRHKSPFDLPPTEALRLCGCAQGLVYAAACVTMAAGGGAWQAARRPGVGAGWARRVGPPRSQPNTRPRFTSPPLAARYVAAHWLRRTEARLVFLQKFPLGRRRSW